MAHVPQYDQDSGRKPMIRSDGKGKRPKGDRGTTVLNLSVVIPEGLELLSHSHVGAYRTPRILLSWLTA